MSRAGYRGTAEGGVELNSKQVLVVLDEPDNKLYCVSASTCVDPLASVCNVKLLGGMSLSRV